MQSDRHITLKCGTVLRLSDLEAAGLSYVPCGQINGEDKPLLSFGHIWGHRRHITHQTYDKKWNAFTIGNMTGVQLMTGFPTYKRGDGYLYLYYTSIDIERRMIDNCPEAVAKIRTLYEENVEGSPCILATKSDGLRLDAYTEYVGKKMSFKDASGKMLFEVLAHKCLARIDHRYAMISGSILNIPTLPKATLQKIYHIIAEISTHEQSDDKPREVVEKAQIGDLDIQWSADGRSQYFTTEHCQETSHASNRYEVRFTKHADGSVDGKCFNCGESWWEIQPKKRRLTKYIPGIEPITTLPHDHPSIANAPPVEVRETPSFRHFSEEERIVVKETLGISPDAGWNGAIPIWTPKYEYLRPLTNKFALNGQPSEVEKRRVWSTLFGECATCGGVAAKWIDRYELNAGIYCDGCHKDYPLGSYLELELNRKLPNSIVSEHQGFLGENPDFADFRLFEPKILTHLGAGMGTGKSTEIYKLLRTLARQGLGKGIIVVPLVALARYLSHYLRARDGYRAWGLWHEGVPKDDKFIGEYGAIVCLPSLPQAVRCAEEYGATRTYIAIDELDFAYELLSLSVQQSTAVKKILRDALVSTGLVVSGQTEFTLAIEAFADEIGAEQIQGFYNTAEAAKGSVILKEHPAEANINSVLAGIIDDVHAGLNDGHNVYSFSPTRRDADIIAEEFSHEKPLSYNAYTKGSQRADDLLRNQKLTDSRLFVGTSAAGVGISILDEKAMTIVANGLVFGSRKVNMSVQESMRDRGRRGIRFHYKPYNLSLPVRPTENRKVSIYHEFLKHSLESYKHLPIDAISKIAYAQALTSLADVQIETYLKYHLGVVGNMEISYVNVPDPSEARTQEIGITRAEIRKIENELKIENAKQILKQHYNLLTSSEIRNQRNKGTLSTDGALANELANHAVQAIGWDDEINRFEDDPLDDVFDEADIEVATALAHKNFDFDALTKKRAGYLAVNAPKWTAHRFQSDVENADRQLTLDGLGIEITAVKDYRFLGELLKSLLDTTVDTVFEQESLATAVKAVLNTKAKSGKTFRQELMSGALGASEYRKARFLHCAEDDALVDWCARFISEWYPARLAKKDKHYALQPDTHSELYLKAFKQWLQHQPDVFDNAHIELTIFSATELPESNAEQKEIARKRRQEGATLKAIAADFGVDPKTIHLWCRGVQPADIKTEVFKMYTELDMKQAEIASHVGKGLATVNRWLKKMGADTKKQQLKAEVFRLYHEERRTQAEIEALLPLNQATISRWLTEGNS